MQDKVFYVTTPIYYPSDKLHIGHALTTTMADTLARFKRLQGYDTWFLTGSDEHGQKIQRRAREQGVSPQLYVDPIVATFQDLWRRLYISNDDFLRTTEDRHKLVVQDIFRRIYEKGDIYKSEYIGRYCTPCETFWTEQKLLGGNCPDCGRPVELLREESYFFRMSRYADRLLRHIENNPSFIQPASRRNEMVSFIKGGLEDLCVSRTTFDWGIPVPLDDRHVIYVWFDALTNYISALGYGSGDPRFDRYWPQVTHLVGKDIVRFHTVIWPIILMAAGIDPPKRVFGHGWLLVEGDKMSKSKGNVVDPLVLIDRYGADAIRYFLLREMPYGADGYYSEDALVNRLNTDLANDLGNLVSRTVSMLQRFAGGVIPHLPPAGATGETGDVYPDWELRQLAVQVSAEVENCLDRFEFSAALATIWRLVARANKYVDETAPWNLAKDPSRRERLMAVLYNLAESVRVITVLLGAFLPGLPERVWAMLGLGDQIEAQTWESILSWGGLPAGLQVKVGPPLFPRIITSPPPEAVAKIDKTTPPVGVNEGAGELKGLISIEDFSRLDLRVVVVLSVARIPRTDKLLQLKVNLGGEERTVVAGIAQHYSPEDLVGKKVILVANLKPTKLKGIESQGMILAASDPQGQLSLIQPDGDRAIAVGARVK